MDVDADGEMGADDMDEEALKVRTGMGFCFGN
jgi:hypothetical protein